MNKKLVLGLSTITILAAVTLLGCSAKKTVVPKKAVSKTTQKKPENNNVKNVSPESLTQLKYDRISIPSNTSIELNTPWETSPNGKFKATIEGKGEKAEEEGYAHIIIKDEKSGKLIKLTMENEEKNQLTAKDLEWIDEYNMFVIIGYPFGTVTMGGKIYKVNIANGKASLYADTMSSKEEYTAVHKSTSGFTFEKYVYDDNNFTKGHLESGILKLK